MSCIELITRVWHEPFTCIYCSLPFFNVPCSSLGGRRRSCGPHGAGAPTGGPEAAATRPEAHGAAPPRVGPAPNLRVSPYWRALPDGRESFHDGLPDQT